MNSSPKSAKKSTKFPFLEANSIATTVATTAIMVKPTMAVQARYLYSRLAKIMRSAFPKNDLSSFVEDLLSAARRPPPDETGTETEDVTP